MKLSSSLLVAVSVNLAAAAVHKGPHPGAHTRNVDSWEQQGMSVVVEEVQQNSSKAGKQHKGNGGKHDSGVDGHHPGYDMSVPVSVAKSSKGKAHKASKAKALSHSISESSKSNSKSAKAHSLSMHTSSSKAAKTMSLSPTSTTTTTVAPTDPTTPAEEPADTTPLIPDSIPIPENLPEPEPETETEPAPEGADTAVLKVIVRDGPADVVLAGGKASQQSKIEDEKSVNLKGQEQASMMSETKNSGSIAKRAGIVAGVACLFASATYWIV